MGNDVDEWVNKIKERGKKLLILKRKKKNH